MSAKGWAVPSVAGNPTVAGAIITSAVPSVAGNPTVAGVSHYYYCFCP
jgi:hypothetical protein